MGIDDPELAEYAIEECKVLIATLPDETTPDGLRDIALQRQAAGNLLLALSDAWEKGLVRFDDDEDDA